MSYSIPYGTIPKIPKSWSRPLKNNEFYVKPHPPIYVIMIPVTIEDVKRGYVALPAILDTRKSPKSNKFTQTEALLSPTRLQFIWRIPEERRKKIFIYEEVGSLTILPREMLLKIAKYL
jgi:hypothetical protein